MRHILIFAIRCYQRVSRFTPRVCRFEPTCSAYAVEALQKYGAVKGGWMALWRLLRCNPFNPGGYDPVR